MSSISNYKYDFHVRNFLEKVIHIGAKERDFICVVFGSRIEEGFLMEEK